MGALTITNLLAEQLSALVAGLELFLAWGSGLDSWGSPQMLLSQSFTANVLATGFTNISGVIVRSADDLTTYTLGTDYTVDAVSGNITKLGGGAISGNVNVYLINGQPTPDGTEVGLANEIARRKVGIIYYVVQDDDGDITVSGVNYSVADGPTALLYIRVTFDQTDAPTSLIKEIGLFSNVTVESDTLVGQLYFLPEDITVSGTLLALQRFNTIGRNAATKQEFQLLLTF